MGDLLDVIERKDNEIIELRAIRTLLIRALVKATGEPESAILDAPLTVAIRHHRKDAALVPAARNVVEQMDRARSGESPWDLDAAIDYLGHVLRSGATPPQADTGGSE